ncbi:hypothetical protein [Roseibium sp.]|uniref:hypothetical protein n=1 Tax=Roseibium sp. TaxID=1936156 RepID=UPI003B51462F
MAFKPNSNLRFCLFELFVKICVDLFQLFKIPIAVVEETGLRRGFRRSRYTWNGRAEIKASLRKTRKIGNFGIPRLSVTLVAVAGLPSFEGEIDLICKQAMFSCGKWRLVRVAAALLVCCRMADKAHAFLERAGAIPNSARLARTIEVTGGRAVFN